MKDMKTSIEQLKKRAVTVLSLASQHRLIVMLFVIGVAVSFALIKTRSFIDIPRNETKYSEEKLKIHFESIDQQTLNEFKSAEQDRSVEVNPQFNPNRSDPFSE